jgi:hypothetical protein
VKKRWIVGGVFAVLLGVSATGIAVNAAWLGGRWDSSHAATDLAAKLQKLDGVTTATAKYDPFGLPNPTVVADVEFAADASPADWSAATALVRSAASTQALSGSTSTANFRQAGSKTHVTVEPMLFTPAVVEEEIAAWRQLRQSVGDRVSLHLGYPSDLGMPSGPIVREYSVGDAAAARKVAELWPETPPPLDPAISTRWSGPGLQLAGMPSKAMMTTLDAVGAILPLASADPEATQTGDFAVILDSLNRYKVTIVSLHDGKLTGGQPSEKMARVAQAAFATGASEVEWEHSGSFGELTSGECAPFIGAQTVQRTLQTLARDETFATQLAELGFVKPADVRAGTCV